MSKSLRSVNNVNEASSLLSNRAESEASIPTLNEINTNLPNNETNRSGRNTTNKPRRKQRTPNFYTYQFLTAINDRRTTSQQNISIIILLLVNTLERFSYYGLICNYVLYLNKQPLYWESYNASTLLFIFLGITYVSSVIGGWIADSLLGKFTTICLSYFIYIIGYAAFPIIAYNDTSVPGFCNSNRTVIDWTVIIPNYNDGYQSVTNRSIANESCSWIIIITVIAIGIAVGFIKANLGPFGADQVISRGQSMVFKYFNWLYWCINLGSLLSFSILAFIQQNYSFFYGYLIPFITLILSFLIFLSGNFCYIKQEAEESIISNILRVIFEAFNSIKRQKKFIRQKQLERALLSDSDEESESETNSNSESLNNYQQNALKYKNVSWLDNAKIRYGGRFDDDLVDDVKSLKNVIILFALLIPYWIVYFQIETTFIVQGLHLRLYASEEENNQNFMIPAAWLSMADQIAVLIMIPLLDSVIYPCLKNKLKIVFCENMRLVLGMALSAMSVIVAGLVESHRIQIIKDNPAKNTVVQIIDNTTYYAANMHIIWQIPQYTLIGLGEAFGSVSSLYFAYSASPKSMQSIIMGIFYFFSGIGSFLGSIILFSLKYYIYSSTKNDDINCPTCHLNYYFYILGILQIFGMILFIIIDSKFSIAKSKNQQSCTEITNDVDDDSSKYRSSTTPRIDNSYSNDISQQTLPRTYQSIDSVNA